MPSNSWGRPNGASGGSSPKSSSSVGVDRLLTVGRMKGTGRTSGAVVDTDWSSLFTTLDGQVICEQIFLDRGEALEAVGRAGSFTFSGRIRID